MIKDIFQCYREEEIDGIIQNCIEKYQHEGYFLSAPGVVRAYFRILNHYLFTERPIAERNIGNLLRLAGASYNEKGFRTPFWSIMRDMALRHPEDPVYATVRQTEAEMNNDYVDEIFEFLEYELSAEPDEAVREQDLGALSFCRICYRQNMVKNIKMKRKVPQRKEESRPAFLERCERFVREYTPHKIKAYLDRFVIGQDEAKEVLSTALYNHYLRILHPEANLIKANVLMIGPSGCGKTELVRRIAELIDLPVVITDFSGVVATPWKGRNKEEALQNLYFKAGRDIELTECGIVFCDEFDKVIPSHRYYRGGDINDELQGQLLGMFEGTELDVPIQEGGGNQILQMDTRDILFICAGAFEGLDKIVKKDYVNAGIGYGRTPGNSDAFVMTGEKLKPKHLMEYGMKPELAGRLSTVTVLDKLDKKAMRLVMTEAEDNVLTRFQREFWIEDEVRLLFTDEAIDRIVDRTMEMNIGARGLNAVVREILAKPMYEVPTMPGVTKVLITGEAAGGEEKAQYL